ncbi:uncharacterized protein B0I36DRAFT_137343 [Microdochium trichocladiopsis]|uniref:Uncharacterized protein n=1 Tax=Microdochium trichocladiopsis TaxID=1682393 RepID=A0A9P8Y4B7_9PEZI|nr:uncharacterized protein B0I36DRAFT_137343 [Microdochium trichocladiopsis]KAH7027321.1 hypothetical protein B0I36DRAFT_137343 [Microdochium trichocladiopsis]
MLQGNDGVFTRGKVVLAGVCVARVSSGSNNRPMLPWQLPVRIRTRESIGGFVFASPRPRRSSGTVSVGIERAFTMHRAETSLAPQTRWVMTPAPYFTVHHTSGCLPFVREANQSIRAGSLGVDSGVWCSRGLDMFSGAPSAGEGMLASASAMMPCTTPQQCNQARAVTAWKTALANPKVPWVRPLPPGTGNVSNWRPPLPGAPARAV